VLLAGFVVQAVATGVMLAGVPYYARQVLGDAGAGSLLFAALVGPAVLVMPVWLAVARRWGKRPGLLAASGLFAAGAAALAVGRTGGTGLVVALVVLVGVGYAGMQMFPLAMLPDVIAADEAASGRRRAGVFTGVWTAAETLGLAIGPGVLGLLLDAAGYVSSSGSDAVQPAGAVTAVRLAFSLLPAVLVLAAVPVFARYRLDRASAVPDQEVPA
jgi:Na+/melibiose symporter-like transporter